MSCHAVQPQSSTASSPPSPGSLLSYPATSVLFVRFTPWRCRSAPCARARRHFAEAVIPRPTDRFRGRRRFGAHAVLHSGNEQKFQQRRRTKANLCCFSNFDGRGRQVFKFNNLDEDRLFFTNNFNHCEVSPRGAQFFIETKGRVAA